MGQKVEKSESQKVRKSESLKVGRSEGRKVGRSESRKVGRLEGWKVGRLEGWKVGKSESHKVEQSGVAMYNDMEVTKEQLFGKVDPARHDDFVLVDVRYANRAGMYMHQEAYAAFVEMHAAAAQDGVTLTIISAMRTFDHQRRIWENKWHGRQILHGNIRATAIDDPVERSLEILRFSAMPGTSRHHWGTDIDLNSLNNSYFESGQGRRVYEWLQAHASSFGFCQPYTSHGAGRTAGYEEEKWHWSYKPVASQYLKAFRELVTIEDITGFDGWETAREIGVIERYVLDVNRACL